MRATLLILTATLSGVVPSALAARCEDDAQSIERCWTGINVFFDNDVLLLDPSGNEDRNYTMGLSFQATGRWIKESGFAQPLYWINNWRALRALEPDYAQSPLRYHALEFGNVAFTPDRLEISEPIPDNRPYASLLFLDTQLQVVSPRQRRAYTTELSLGILGLEISEHFQRWLHKQLQDSPDDPPFPPEGWSNQISDGGELTARFTARWQRAPLLRRHADAQWIAEGNLGYHTNVGAGAALRIGRIVSPWWQFNAAPISQAQILGAQLNEDTAALRSEECPSNGHRPFELYGWGGTMARLWAYNVLLQGQFRDSAVTVDASDVERLVIEYSLGITGGLCLSNSWHRLSFAYSRRSPEFDGPERRYHSWGGVYYSWAF